MFEIIKVYPLIFFCTVIIPIIGGLVGGYIGWDALKSRHKDSIHKQEIKESISSIDSKLAPITSQIAVIERYEKKLSSHDQKDEVLSAILAQYKQMKKATENFHKLRGIENESERGKLAEHILSTIANNLIPVAEVTNLPGRPLIINLGVNTFKIVFSVPMRIPPHLEFQGLLEGVSAQVSENTTFGFIVKFLPAEIPVSNFGFTASAEL
ncbi:MAG: hypothetical protein GY775_11965 [Candidatus Scalindua sp.]|nr:hypothetical protein [Candidatus Scalindua sp.]